MNGVSALIKETQRAPNEKITIYGLASGLSSGTKSAGTSILSHLLLSLYTPPHFLLI